MTARTYEPWAAPVVTAVAGVLGDTAQGLTGREIGQLLAAVRVPEVEGGNKRDRLAGALLAQQARQQVSNCVIAFITAAMAPVRYAQQPQTFSRRQDDLNEVLVHVGLRVNDEGKLAKGAAAATLNQAAQHASSLRSELRRRSTHPEVLRYCTLEILAKNPFHASLEAVKSVGDRLQKLTGQGLDGARLVDAVLMPGQGTARVAVNTNATVPELDEQKGLANLVKGLFSMYRNPAAHEPRLHRTVTDEELLELLTTLSMVHRRLDGAHVTP
ncbi:TIGR02391 family protein [Streptomyces sp. NPDC002730]|uniref:TIGR02391 family protein n=1 Tax=Streptomyces sp. NPDC002730 TaxID=3364662 RepID=UPI0036AA46A3